MHIWWNSWPGKGGQYKYPVWQQIHNASVVVFNMFVVRPWANDSIWRAKTPQVNYWNSCGLLAGCNCKSDGPSCSVFFKCFIGKSGLVQDYRMFVNGVEWWHIFSCRKWSKITSPSQSLTYKQIGKLCDLTSLPPDGLVGKSRNQHGFLYCSLNVFEVRINAFCSIDQGDIWNTQVEWFGFENPLLGFTLTTLFFNVVKRWPRTNWRKVKSMWTKACCVYGGDDWSHHISGELVLGTWVRSGFFGYGETTRTLKTNHFFGDLRIQQVYRIIYVLDPGDPPEKHLHFPRVFFV